MDTIAIANRLLQNPSLREGIANQAVLKGTDIIDRANAIATLYSSATQTAQPLSAPTATPAATTNATNSSSTATPAAPVTATSGNAANLEISGYYLLKGLEIPIGWPDQSAPLNPNVGFLLSKIVGLLITTFATTQGAPFWFDLLNKLTNLRATGAKPKVEDDAKKDAADDKAK